MPPPARSNIPAASLTRSDPPPPPPIKIDTPPNLQDPNNSPRSPHPISNGTEDHQANSSPALSQIGRRSRSIRCKDNDSDDEGSFHFSVSEYFNSVKLYLFNYLIIFVRGDELGVKKQKRGKVNGTKLARYVAQMGGGKLKVVKSARHNGPASRWLRSLLVHQIGCCVREKLPMIAESYTKLCKLDPEYQFIVFDHLSTTFEIAQDDKWLREYISAKINSRFRD